MIDAILATLTNEQKAALQWAWHGFWLRPDVREPGAMIGEGQEVPPGDHVYIVFQGGRGSGKTTPCVIAFADDAHALGKAFVGFVLCENDEEARKLIDDPESGMRAILPPWKRPEFKSSVEGGHLTFPSGAIARVLSAEKPSKGRSGNYNRGLIDDPPKFGPNGLEVFDTLMRALRKQGHGLRCYIATTPPSRESPPRCPELLEAVLAAQLDPAQGEDWVYSVCASDANLTNLDKDTRRILKRYEGSPDEDVERRGIYDPSKGAKVFHGIAFHAPPIRCGIVPERFDVIVISIDPNRASTTVRCEVGIAAIGLVTRTPRAFVLEDASGLFAEEWPTAAWDLAEKWAPRGASWRFVIEDNVGNKDSALLRAEERNRRLARGEPGVNRADIRPITSRKTKPERADPLRAEYLAGHVQHGPLLASRSGGPGEAEMQLARLDNSGRGMLDRADAIVQGLLDVLGFLDAKHPAPLLGKAPAFEAGAFGASRFGEAADPLPAELSITMSTPGKARAQDDYSAGAFGTARRF